MDCSSEIKKKISSIETEKVTQKLLNILSTLSETLSSLKKKEIPEETRKLIQECKEFLNENVSQEQKENIIKNNLVISKEDIPQKETKEPVLKYRSLIPKKEHTSTSFESTPIQAPVIQTPNNKPVAESSSIPRPFINRHTQQTTPLSENEIILSPKTMERIQTKLKRPSFSDDLSSLDDEILFFQPQKRLREENVFDHKKYMELPEHVQKRISIDDFEEAIKDIKEFSEEKNKNSLTKEELEDCITGIYPKDTIQSLVYFGILNEATDGYSIQ